MNMACALTGHRELPSDFNLNALYDELETLVVKGYDRFFCGMARGFDLAALRCLADLRMKYPITLVACIPCLGQERSFPENEKRLYRELLGSCAERVILGETHDAASFLERDRYMVERADLVFAYCTRQTGGTAYTVRYAEKNGVPVMYFKNHR